jgi:hypothetical protein
MPATQTGKPTVIFATVGDRVDTEEMILAFHVVAPAGVAGDVVELQDTSGAVIDHYVIDGANFDREYVINAPWTGVVLTANTAAHATVYMKRRGMPGGGVAHGKSGSW